MNINQNVCEGINPVLVAAAAAGAMTGDWVNMKNAQRIAVVISADATAEDLTITLQQATDNAGADAKALTVKRFYTGLTSKTFNDAVDAPVASVALAGGSAGMVVLEVMVLL